MFHAAELERRQQHDVELPERIGDVGVVLHPAQRVDVAVDEHVEVRGDEPRVETDVVDAHRAVAAHEHALGEGAGREGDEVGRDRRGLCERDAGPRRTARVGMLCARLGAAVGHGGPCRRDIERQRPHALQVGLVEAGDRLVRAGRHEDRVEVVGAAVQRSVACGEHDVDRVRAVGQPLRRQHEVPVQQVRLDRHAVDGKTADRP